MDRHASLLSLSQYGSDSSDEDGNRNSSNSPSGSSRSSSSSSNRSPYSNRQESNNDGRSVDHEDGLQVDNGTAAANPGTATTNETSGTNTSASTEELLHAAQLPVLLPEYDASESSIGFLKQFIHDRFHTGQHSTVSEAAVQPAPEMVEKVRALHQKWMYGVRLNRHLRVSKAQRNPMVLEQLVDAMQIYEIGSEYPTDIYDPNSFDENEFFDKLLARAQRKRPVAVAVAAGGAPVPALAPVPAPVPTNMMNVNATVNATVPSNRSAIDAAVKEAALRAAAMVAQRLSSSSSSNTNTNTNTNSNSKRQAGDGESAESNKRMKEG